MRFSGKGISALLLCGALAGCVCGGQARQTDHPGAQIARNGKSMAEIIVPELPSPPVATAARELRKWIAAISGAELEIYHAPTKTPNTKIFLGREFAGKYREDLAAMSGSDGTAVRREGSKLYVFGAQDRGVLNGVYELLDRNTDLIFARPDRECGSVFSKQSDLLFHETDFRIVPGWKERHFALVRHHFDPWSHEWSMRNFANYRGMFFNKYHILSSLESFFSSSVTYEYGTLLAAEGRFERHPEFFGWKEGKRHPYKHYGVQVCYTSGEGVETLIRETLKALKHDMTPEISEVHFGFGDTWDLCLCPECMKPIRCEDGTLLRPGDDAFRSTQYYRYLNRITDAVSKAYPNLKISTLAYLYAAVPPKVKLHPRLTVIFCPYVKNDKIPVTAPGNAVWEKRSREWAKAGRNIGIYEYYGDSSDFPRPIADTAMQDMRFWNSLNINSYLSLETYPDYRLPKVRDDLMAGAWDVSGVEYWCIGRLMWDPSQDVRALRRKYFHRAYREAAPDVERFYAILHQAWYSDAFPAYWNDIAYNSAAYYILKKGNEKAMRAALESAAEKVRHPASAKLLHHLRARFEHLVEVAATIPETLTLNVPCLSEAAKAGEDFDSPLWKRGGVIDGLRPYGKAEEKLPADKDAAITLLHDRLNLYVKWSQRLPLKAEKGRLQLPELECSPDRNYPRDQVWKNGVNTRMTLEFFLAPPDRSRYFQFACNNHGALYDAEGYNAKFGCGFRAKVRKTATAFEAIFTVPLLELGINVNTGNRISGMFCGPFGSWNGGQVHQMSGFQNLYLEMQ